MKSNPGSLREEEVKFFHEITEFHKRIDYSLIKFVTKSCKLNLFDYENIGYLFKVCMSFNLGETSGVNRGIFNALFIRVFFSSGDLNIFEDLVENCFHNHKRKAEERSEYKSSFEMYLNYNLRMIIINSLNNCVNEVLLSSYSYFLKKVEAPTSINPVYFCFILLMLIPNQKIRFSSADNEEIDKNSFLAYDDDYSESILKAKSKLLFKVFDYKDKGFIESGNAQYLYLLRQLVYQMLFFDDVCTISAINLLIEGTEGKEIYGDLFSVKLPGYYSKLVKWKSFLFFMCEPSYMNDFISYISHNFIFTEKRTCGNLYLEDFMRNLKSTNYDIFYPDRMRFTLYKFIMVGKRTEINLFFTELPKFVWHYYNITEKNVDQRILNSINFQIIKKFNLESKYHRYDLYLRNFENYSFFNKKLNSSFTSQRLQASSKNQLQVIINNNQAAINSNLKVEVRRANIDLGTQASSKSSFTRSGPKTAQETNNYSKSFKRSKKDVFNFSSIGAGKSSLKSKESSSVSPNKRLVLTELKLGMDPKLNEIKKTLGLIKEKPTYEPKRTSGFTRKMTYDTQLLIKKVSIVTSGKKEKSKKEEEELEETEVEKARAFATKPTLNVKLLPFSSIKIEETAANYQSSGKTLDSLSQNDNDHIRLKHNFFVMDEPDDDQEMYKDRPREISDLKLLSNFKLSSVTENIKNKKIIEIKSCIESNQSPQKEEKRKLEDDHNQSMNESNQINGEDEKKPNDESYDENINTILKSMTLKDELREKKKSFSTNANIELEIEKNKGSVFDFNIINEEPKKKDFHSSFSSNKSNQSIDTKLKEQFKEEMEDRKEDQCNNEVNNIKNGAAGTDEFHDCCFNLETFGQNKSLSFAKSKGKSEGNLFEEGGIPIREEAFEKNDDIHESIMSVSKHGLLSSKKVLHMKKEDLVFDNLTLVSVIRKNKSGIDVRNESLLDLADDQLDKIQDFQPKHFFEAEIKRAANNEELSKKSEESKNDKLQLSQAEKMSKSIEPSVNVNDENNETVKIENSADIKSCAHEDAIEPEAFPNVNNVKEVQEISLAMSQRAKNNEMKEYIREDDVKIIKNNRLNSVIDPTYDDKSFPPIEKDHVNHKENSMKGNESIFDIEIKENEQAHETLANLPSIRESVIKSTENNANTINPSQEDQHIESASYQEEANYFFALTQKNYLETTEDIEPFQTIKEYFIGFQEVDLVLEVERQKSRLAELSIKHNNNQDIISYINSSEEILRLSVSQFFLDNYAKILNKLVESSEGLKRVKLFESTFFVHLQNKENYEILNQSTNFSALFEDFDVLVFPILYTETQKSIESFNIFIAKLNIKNREIVIYDPSDLLVMKDTEKVICINYQIIFQSFFTYLSECNIIPSKFNVWSLCLDHHSSEYEEQANVISLYFMEQIVFGNEENEDSIEESLKDMDKLASIIFLKYSEYVRLSLIFSKYEGKEV